MMPPMSRTKNLQYLLRTPLVVLPFFFACASGAGKPAVSADGADSKPSTSEEATAEESGKDASNKSDIAADEESSKSDEKSEAKSSDTKDKKAAAKDDDDSGEAAPKDDSRTTAACAKVINDNRKLFKKCYKDRSDIKGEIVLQVKLDAAGKVTKAFIDEESTIKDVKVHTCILDIAKGLTYPASTKGLEKDFEYNFGINNATK